MKKCYQGFLWVAALAGCAEPPPPPKPASAAVPAPGGYGVDAQIPPFARVPYAPISRAAVVAIAMREWRLFGQPVDDSSPEGRPPPLPDQKPERYEGLWQRVGEYWWLGMDANTREAAYTGMHDANGNVFPASKDGSYAWSAAFVSYVMRIAGAGSAFPYSATHATYINIARQMTDATEHGYLVFAERPESYAPQLGDLICERRTANGHPTYDDLPTSYSFPGHCDIVVDSKPNEISVLGGNVDDAVTMKHIPVTADGKLATPDGIILDTRYPWFVVLRVNYPAPAS
jgi:hypothetical protein